MGAEAHFLDSLTLCSAAAVSQPMAVFKPRLRFHCISRKKDALCSPVIKRVAKGAMSIILTLISKMVTTASDARVL